MNPESVSHLEHMCSLDIDTQTSFVRLSGIICTTEAYLWENHNEPVVEWLEGQKKSDSTVCRNIYAVKKDAIVSQIQKALEDCPEAALDAVIGLCQALSPAHRGEVVKTLSQLEFTEKEHASMG